MQNCGDPKCEACNPREVSELEKKIRDFVAKENQPMQGREFRTIRRALKALNKKDRGTK
jgi:hypothetical protein